MERPQFTHLTNVRAVHIGCVCKTCDLVHLLPESQGELAWHGTGEGKAEVLAGCDVHLGIEGIALGNADGQAFRVDPLVRVTVFAAQDRVTKAPAIYRTRETYEREIDEETC